MKKIDVEELFNDFKKKDRRALSRIISLIENNFYKIQKKFYLLLDPTRKSYIIGVTGAPGAGKSSLINMLIEAFRNEGKSVGVIAVDPTSHRTGGAFLGDRIRMQAHTLDDKVFIRSMGSRNGKGGLSLYTPLVIKLLESYGFDIIIVETVGIGQEDIEIFKLSDTGILVVTPESGDDIQLIKAGNLEEADIIVINKSDREGADKLYKEFKRELGNAKNFYGFTPVILKVSSLRKEGISDLVKALLEHKKFLEEKGLFEKKRKERNISLFFLLMEHEIKEKLRSESGLLREIEEGMIDPFTAMGKAMDIMCKQGGDDVKRD